MLELAALLHDISVAFAASSNSWTLLPRLAVGMARHLPVVEVEAARLRRNGESVQIAAYAPISGRMWTGERSARFLERQEVYGATWCGDLEPARVGIAPVHARLKLPVGAHGLLSVSFETDISVILGAPERLDILVDSLLGHCLRLGQLDATARLCRRRNRYIGEARDSARADPPRHTDISVSEEAAQNTEIPVVSIDAALIQCISAALEATRGRIYGDAGAAKRLGVKPSTLQSKMRKLGIERRRFVK